LTYITKIKSCVASQKNKTGQSQIAIRLSKYTYDRDPNLFP